MSEVVLGPGGVQPFPGGKVVDYLQRVGGMLREVSDVLPMVGSPDRLGQIAAAAALVAEQAAGVQVAARTWQDELLAAKKEAEFDQTVDILLAATWHFAWGRHRFQEAELREHLEQYVGFGDANETDFAELFGLLRERVAEDTGTEWVQSGPADDIHWGLTVPLVEDKKGAESDTTVAEVSTETLPAEAAPPAPATAPKQEHAAEPEDPRQHLIEHVVGLVATEGGVRRSNVLAELGRLGVEKPVAFLDGLVTDGHIGRTNRKGHVVLIRAAEARAQTARIRADAARRSLPKPEGPGVKDPSFDEAQKQIALRIFDILNRIRPQYRQLGLQQHVLINRTVESMDEATADKRVVKAILHRLVSRGIIERRSVKSGKQSVIKIFPGCLTTTELSEIMTRLGSPHTGEK